MNPTLNDYKLSCELLGHSLDVRSVTQGENSNVIISGSRDKTTKIWINEGGEYREQVTLKNHSNFISCVYYLETENWICTGSNDSTICIYCDGSQTPFVILRGHEGTVCTISKGLTPKTIISGSWDKTGKIWTIDKTGTSTFVNLNGHEAAVWAVTSIRNGNYVTGSADKNIFYWNLKGEKLKILKGHTDCVRGLIGLDDGSLISCGNDATIRYWNDDGECIKELHGHNNYIYTISINHSIGNDILVSGSEDNTIRMWSLKSGSLGDAIVLPAQSVWSVACLNNGDIVTGSSDGIIRIFTRDPARVANSDVRDSYNLAVATRQIENNAELGGIKKNDLPGPESLIQPGKDGQTKMVRQPDGKVFCYQWENNKWNAIGEVTGASGGTQSTSGKTLYEGKEYDYVFSVDISDTDPPIKLPYNRGEDPWHTAQKFIHKNNLPQAYLDQVANFIVKNSDTPILHHQTANSSYQDPFTGGNRYVPGTSTNEFSTIGNVDPFTGSSSYSTQAATNQPLVNFTGGQKKHFPYNKYSTFDNCDANKVLDKLRDFNSKTGDNNMSVNEEILQAVIKLTEKEPQLDSNSINGILHLLNWPKEILFPVLDVARLSIRNEEIYNHLNPSSFLDNIIQNLNSTAANQLMSIRCITNLMRHETGRKNIFLRIEHIIEILKNIKEGSANLQIALATFYLNLSVAQVHVADQEKCRLIADGILELLKWSMDLEACYRSLQGLGNLSCTPYGQIANAQVISVDYVMDKIRELANTKHQNGFEKINECANSLIASF